MGLVMIGKGVTFVGFIMNWYGLISLNNDPLTFEPLKNRVWRQRENCSVSRSETTAVTKMTTPHSQHHFHINGVRKYLFHLTIHYRGYDS